MQEISLREKDNLEFEMLGCLDENYCRDEEIILKFYNDIMEEKKRYPSFLEIEMMAQTYNFDICREMAATKVREDDIKIVDSDLYGVYSIEDIRYMEIESISSNIYNDFSYLISNKVMELIFEVLTNLKLTYYDDFNKPVICKNYNIDYESFDILVNPPQMILFEELYCREYNEDSYKDYIYIDRRVMW